MIEHAPMVASGKLTVGEEVDRRLEIMRAQAQAERLSDSSYDDLTDIFNMELHANAQPGEEVVEITPADLKRMEAYNDQMLILMDEANIVDGLKGDAKYDQILHIFDSLNALRGTPDSGLTPRDIGKLKNFWVHVTFVKTRPTEQFGSAEKIQKLKQTLKERRGVVPANPGEQAETPIQ